MAKWRKSPPQLEDHLDAANEDSEISDDLYKLRAHVGHQGPFKATDPNSKGCMYNILVEWETGEKTHEALSVLAAEDPVTCGTYAMRMTFYMLMAGKGSGTLQRGMKT